MIVDLIVRVEITGYFHRQVTEQKKANRPPQRSRKPAIVDIPIRNQQPDNPVFTSHDAP